MCFVEFGWVVFDWFIDYYGKGFGLVVVVVVSEEFVFVGVIGGV